MRRPAVVLLLVFLAGCGKSGPSRLEGAFTLTSPAFKDGRPIPPAYTCDGGNGSPELRWSGTPAGTKSFALLYEDVSGPQRVLVHWVVWNIPSTAEGLPAKMPRSFHLPDGTRQGNNDLFKRGYDGPCPPTYEGASREYVFSLYALDTMFADDRSLSGSLLLDLIEGHVLSRARLRGIYLRQAR